MVKFLLAFLLVVPIVSAVSVTPTEKVVQLLEDMKAQGIEEKQQEEVQFASFKTFCANTIKTTAATIEENKDEIERLTADINKADQDAVDSGDAVEKLAGEITVFEQQVEAQKKRKSRTARCISSRIERFN